MVFIDVNTHVGSKKMKNYNNSNLSFYEKIMVFILMFEPRVEIFL